jgi:hypothetical protein
MNSISLSAIIFFCLISERVCFQYTSSGLWHTRNKRIVSTSRKPSPQSQAFRIVMDAELESPLTPPKQRERVPLAIGQSSLSFFQDPEILGPLLGGTGRAKMVWSCLKQGIDPCSEQGIESAKTKLVLSTCFEGIPTISKQTVASCGTTKLLLDLNDGLQVSSITRSQSSKLNLICCRSG